MNASRYHMLTLLADSPETATEFVNQTIEALLRGEDCREALGVLRELGYGICIALLDS